MAFKKGKSGNPRGRPPILMPEVRLLADKSKNEIKMLLAKLLNMTDAEFCARLVDRGISKTERLFIKCIDQIETDGNIDGYRKLLEILVGKLPEEKEEFPMSFEEKLIIQEYRKRLDDLNRTPTLDSSPEPS